MSNIIDFQKWKDADKEPEGWGYKTWDREIAICSKFIDFEIYRKNADVIYVEVFGEVEQVDRKGFAEFLWAAAYFLDSDEEWADGEYVCLDKSLDNNR